MSSELLPRLITQAISFSILGLSCVTVNAHYDDRCIPFEVFLQLLHSQSSEWHLNESISWKHSDEKLPDKLQRLDAFRLSCCGAVSLANMRNILKFKIHFN